MVCETRAKCPTKTMSAVTRPRPGARRQEVPIPATRVWTAGCPDDWTVSDDPGGRARDGEAWFAEAEDAARCGAARGVP